MTASSEETTQTVDFAHRKFSFRMYSFTGADGIKALGIGWLIATNWLFNGLVGVVVALLIGLVTTSSRPTVVIGIAHAGLLLLYPDIATLQTAFEVVIFEIGLLAILLIDPPARPIAILLTVTLSVVFGTALFAIGRSNGYVAAVTILLFMILLVAYIIHRYEQVSLGLVEADSDVTEPNS